MGKRLEELIERLIHALERANIEEYMRYSGSWRRQFLVNFMGGLARGFGMAVGFTILGALMVMLLLRPYIPLKPGKRMRPLRPPPMTCFIMSRVASNCLMS